MKTGFRVDTDHGLQLVDPCSGQRIQGGCERQIETMSDGDGYVGINEAHLQ